MFYPFFLHFYEKLPRMLPVRNVTYKKMLPIQSVLYKNEPRQYVTIRKFTIQNVTDPIRDLCRVTHKGGACNDDPKLLEHDCLNCLILVFCPSI